MEKKNNFPIHNPFNYSFDTLDDEVAQHYGLEINVIHEVSVLKTNYTKLGWGGGSWFWRTLPFLNSTLYIQNLRFSLQFLLNKIFSLDILFELTPLL